MSTAIYTPPTPPNTVRDLFPEDRVPLIHGQVWVGAAEADEDGDLTAPLTEATRLLYHNVALDWGLTPEAVEREYAVFIADGSASADVTRPTLYLALVAREEQRL